MNSPEAVVQTAYRLVLEARAPTLSGSGGIRYAVLTDPGRSRVFLTILTNEGSGNFNREIVAFDDIEEAIADQPADTRFGVKVFRVAFIGKSNNNAGFLAAALVHAGLLAPSGVKHQYLKSGDWPAFEADMLARDVAETFLFPPTLPEAGQADVTPAVALPAPDKPVKANRRGGNRLIPVETAPAVEEGGDADRPCR
jgi:hypothetical protein